MKAVHAIFASVLLIWSQVMAASESACPVAARKAMDCCGHCGRACCRAPETPVSQPVPAAPAPSNAHSQFLNLAPATPAWVLSLSESSGASFREVPGSVRAGAPLYERNCALLI